MHAVSHDPATPETIASSIYITKPPIRAMECGCRGVTLSTTRCLMLRQTKRSKSNSSSTLLMRQSGIGPLSLGVIKVQLLFSTLMVFNQTRSLSSKSSRTRLQSTPHQSTPHQSTPHQSTPRQSTPHQPTPRQSTPRQSTQRQSTPRQSTPRQSAPRLRKPGSIASLKHLAAIVPNMLKGIKMERTRFV